MADACGLREELECQEPGREGQARSRVELETGSWRGSRCGFNLGRGREARLDLPRGGGWGGAEFKGGGQGSRLPATSLTAWPAGAGPVRTHTDPGEIDLRSVGWGNLSSCPSSTVRLACATSCPFSSGPKPRCSLPAQVSHW